MYGEETRRQRRRSSGDMCLDFKRKEDKQTDSSRKSDAEQADEYKIKLVLRDKPHESMFTLDEAEIEHYSYNSSSLPYKKNNEKSCNVNIICDITTGKSSNGERRDSKY